MPRSLDPDALPADPADAGAHPPAEPPRPVADGPPVTEALSPAAPWVVKFWADLDAYWDERSRGRPGFRL
jgi:hypothetical protein